VKILLVSDLHADPDKLAWVATHAGAFDFVAIAGDLLNIFSSEDPSEQKDRVLKWKQAALKAGRVLVWCSGNHDFFHGEDSPMINAAPDWMSGCESNFIGDGSTHLLTTKSGTIAVTTVPWPVTAGDVLIDGRMIPFPEYVDRLLEAGKALQRNHPWLVLIHEPPIDTALSIDYHSWEANFTRQLIEKWQPDWSLHGHLHESVGAVEGSFHEQIGNTICFNAGQSPDGEDPHYIILQIGDGNWTVRWVGLDSQARIDRAISDRV
jgi:Icc-related predicted phosphoesterase